MKNVRLLSLEGGDAWVATVVLSSSSVKPVYWAILSIGSSFAFICWARVCSPLAFRATLFQSFLLGSVQYVVLDADSVDMFVIRVTFLVRHVVIDQFFTRFRQSGCLVR